MLKGVVKVWSEYCLHQISQRQRPRSRASVVPFCPGNQWRVSSGSKLPHLPSSSQKPSSEVIKFLDCFHNFPPPQAPKHLAVQHTARRLSSFHGENADAPSGVLSGEILMFPFCHMSKWISCFFEATKVHLPPPFSKKTAGLLRLVSNIRIRSPDSSCM